MVPLNGEDALSNKESCFICGGNKFINSTTDYRGCLNCGHEILISTKEQTFIINDNLTEKEIHHITGLDRFKSNMLSNFDDDIDRQHLLDIGSASGKFLFHNASRYRQATGIEITPESLTFSRKKLGLNVVEDMQDISDDISVATAWHSLEHIPEKYLTSLLKSTSDKMVEGGRFIISVPNSSSWQYRLFGKAFAYYDVPNHLHQFTPDSLKLLMQHFGFKHVSSVNSWPYNVFGYIQSLLNIFTNTHNYLYYRLKRRSRKPSTALDIVNGLLLVICVPTGWLFALLDKMNLKHQGVITACFQKKTC